MVSCVYKGIIFREYFQNGLKLYCREWNIICIYHKKEDKLLRNKLL